MATVAPMPTQPSEPSPYPCFTYPSIAARCMTDLDQFNNVYKFDVSEYSLPGFESGAFVAATTLAELQSRMKSITDKIVSTSGKSMADFDYPHQIREYDDTVQKKLWCLRTLLFYQLLITVTEMLNNKQLFDAVYAYSTSQGITPKRDFRDDIVSELKNYKLGIFGSITPLSDIDLGVQFSGFNSLVGLAHIVSVLEDLFLILTGKNSLILDIEIYADLVTFAEIKDKPISDAAASSLACSNVRDVFPFDTSKLNYDNFMKLLPFIFAGIIRNYVIAKKAVSPADESVADIANSFNYQDFLNVAAEKTGTQLLDILRVHRPQTVTPEKMNEELMDAFNKAKDIAIGYMSSSYADAREKYYELVQKAEASTVQMKQIYFETDEVNVPNEEFIQILMNVSNALVYREESYICPATVMHVVRVLQANSKNPEKYASIEPSYCVTNKLSDAYCAIGSYGYLISLFEQLGYIYRFHLTYCQSDHLDATKCASKIKKYVDRFTNGLNMLNKLPKPVDAPQPQLIQPIQAPEQIPVTTAGGSRRRMKKKSSAKKTMKKKSSVKKTMKKKSSAKTMKKKSSAKKRKITNKPHVS